MSHTELLPTPTFGPEVMQPPAPEIVPLTEAERDALDEAFGRVVEGLENLDVTAPEVVAEVEVDTRSDRKTAGKGDTKIKRDR